ncbi:MAG: YabP/YqfC family sporulation protein [Ruminococcus sp.]|nr:YabP/YqfC family sporulation protein [Ruminococcus sp.]
MKQTNQPKSEQHHNLILEDRNNISLSGVTDVDCFDERVIRLYTQLGELTVKGRNLHVDGVSLESGDMKISGDIWSLIYGDRDKTGPLSAFGKLFR